MSVVIIVVILFVAVVWRVCSLGVVRVIVVVSSKMLAKKCEIFQQICTSIFHIFMALESKTAHQCHAPTRTARIHLHLWQSGRGEGGCRRGRA